MVPTVLPITVQYMYGNNGTIYGNVIPNSLFIKLQYYKFRSAPQS